MGPVDSTTAAHAHSRRIPPDLFIAVTAGEGQPEALLQVISTWDICFHFLLLQALPPESSQSDLLKRLKAFQRLLFPPAMKSPYRALAYPALRGSQTSARHSLPLFLTPTTGLSCAL